MLKETTRENIYLAKGDTVLWRSKPGTLVPATITKIELCEEKETTIGVTVDLVQWSMQDYCVVFFDNGRWAFGNEILPAGVEKRYRYPEPDRCN